MKYKFLAVLAILSASATALAADPTQTLYSYSMCEGSYTPYPDNIVTVAYPDSLQPVMINHVGRHGARYPSSPAHCRSLLDALRRADSLGTVTPLGRELEAIARDVVTRAAGNWGALDSLGMAEQRAIASRMYAAYPNLFKDNTVSAISSYSPRAMMSMMSFVHQLDRLSNKPDYIMTSGRVNSPLMRPFDVDNDYLEFRKEDPVKTVYDEFFDAVCPTSAVSRVLGRDYPFENAAEWRQLAMSEYYVIAGLAAMGIQCDASRFFTADEYNALWSCFNMRQYLQRTATTISSVPADIASDLVLNIVQTTDNFIEGSDPCPVHLRFGHAETIMPLASLLRLPACYYMTNYFDTVALHWKNFHVVPMASNLQFILFKTKNGGRYYLRVDLNEVPLTLIPGNDSIYIPWSLARDYMMRCVPLYAQ